MVSFVDTRDALCRRLDAVFGPDTFPRLHPDCNLPRVSKGFPVNEPPYYVVVDEIVDSASTSGAATMGHANWEFTVHVWCFAQHKDQEVAANTALAYADVVFKSVLADQSIDGTVDNSFPAIEAAGTSADSSKRYVAAVAIAVTCTTFSACPQELMEAVTNANRNR